MAKLSQRQSKRVAFVASKLALSIGHDERMALLTELLDELGIDAERRADSKDSAQRSVSYDARQRRRAAKQADDIDNMSHDEVRRYIDELYAKRDALLAQRAEQKPDMYAMSDEERAAYQDYLLRKLQGATTPEPAPVVTDAPQYDLPTSRMEKAIARFDDLADSDQIDALREMWGEDGQP